MSILAVPTITILRHVRLSQWQRNRSIVRKNTNILSRRVDRKTRKKILADNACVLSDPPNWTRIPDNYFDENFRDLRIVNALLISWFEIPKQVQESSRDGSREDWWELFKRVTESRRHRETKVLERRSFVSREPEAGCFLVGLNKICLHLSKYSKDSAWLSCGLSLPLVWLLGRVRTQSRRQVTRTNGTNKREKWPAAAGRCARSRRPALVFPSSFPNGASARPLLPFFLVGSSTATSVRCLRRSSMQFVKWNSNNTVSKRLFSNFPLGYLIMKFTFCGERFEYH